MFHVKKDDDHKIPVLRFRPDTGFFCLIIIILLGFVYSLSSVLRHFEEILDAKLASVPFNPGAPFHFPESDEEQKKWSSFLNLRPGNQNNNNNNNKNTNAPHDSNVPAVTDIIPKVMQLEMFFQLKRAEFNRLGEYSRQHVDSAKRLAIRRMKAVIVTAASSQFQQGLKSLVGSVHFWDSERNIVVFDLGLERTFVDALRNFDRVLVLKNPSEGIELGTYAWKPACIREATARFGKTIWLDAGSDFRAPPKAMDDLLEKEDMFFVQGQDISMQPWATLQTLKFFGMASEEARDLYSFSGNLQGYTYQSQAYYQVLLVTELCSRIPECIAPSGSSKTNHRYDQIAMSSAIYTSPTLRVTPHTEFLAASRLQLQNDYHTASKHVVFSGRSSSPEYSHNVLTLGTKFDAPHVAQVLGENWILKE